MYLHFEICVTAGRSLEDSHFGFIYRNIRLLYIHDKPLAVFYRL